MKSSDYNQYTTYQGKDDDDNEAIIKTIPALFYTTISEPVYYECDCDKTHNDGEDRAVFLKNCNKIDKGI